MINYELCMGALQSFSVAVYMGYFLIAGDDQHLIIIN